MSSNSGLNLSLGDFPLEIYYECFSLMDLPSLSNFRAVNQECKKLVDSYVNYRLNRLRGDVLSNLKYLLDDVNSLFFRPYIMKHPNYASTLVKNLFDDTAPGRRIYRLVNIIRNEIELEEDVIRHIFHTSRDRKAFRYVLENATFKISKNKQIESVEVAVSPQEKITIFIKRKKMNIN